MDRLDPIAALRRIAYYKDRAREDSRRVMAYRNAADVVEAMTPEHREKVGKANSWQTLPGIGPKTRVALLKTLGSLASVRSASDEVILAVPGVSKKHLSALREWFARDVKVEPPTPA